MQYTVDYFIKKFEAIPEVLWAEFTRYEDGRRCALGWCYTSAKSAIASMDMSFNTSSEEKALTVLVRQLNPRFGVGGVNNGIYDEYKQPTPKQRILAALYDIKKMQETKVKEVIRYVAVPETISEMETILN